MDVKLSSKVETAYRLFESRIRAGEWTVGFCMPTEFELAAELGCGRNTISQAITRLVHEGLVERRKRAGTRVIRRAAPAVEARVELDAFAFIYASPKHEGTWRMVRGFQDAAQDRFRRVVTLSVGDDYAKEGEYLRRLPEFGVRGAVIYPVLPSLEAQVQFSKILVESKFPVVLADLNIPNLGCPGVIVDGFHAGYTMTQYLLKQGLQRIGFFCNHSLAPSVVDRYQGYCWALEEAGLPLELDLVLREPSMHPNYDDPLREPTALGHGYLERPSRPEGVVCSNDFLARGLLRAAAEKGVAVPDDLKVVGIDDLAPEAGDTIGLTTYHVPFELMGRTAFETLQALCDERTLPDAEIRSRGHLILRQSA